MSAKLRSHNNAQFTFVLSFSKFWWCKTLIKMFMGGFIGNLINAFVVHPHPSAR